jgi:Sep15/SelM redox domain
VRNVKSRHDFKFLRFRPVNIRSVENSISIHPSIAVSLRSHTTLSVSHRPIIMFLRSNRSLVIPFLRTLLLVLFLSSFTVCASIEVASASTEQEKFRSLRTGESNVANHSSNKIGIIWATSLCHLDLHPTLKRFLNDQDGAQSYENVQVIFVAGQRPILVITTTQSTDGTETISGEEERVQLWHLQTEEEFHSLLQSKGFRKRQNQNEEIVSPHIPKIRRHFQHAAAKQAYFDAQSHGKDTNESSQASMDAFLMVSNKRTHGSFYKWQDDALAATFHRRILESQKNRGVPLEHAPKSKNGQIL